jgi:hypothetical protein
VDWLIQYKESVFGGIGIVIVAGITGILLKKGEPNSQPVSGGKSKGHGRESNNGGPKLHEEY